MGEQDHLESQLDVNDLQRLYETFREETDRGAAIVGAAYLEARLAELLAAFLTKEATQAKGDLKWPLESYRKRVILAHWMGLISDDERHDLEGIGAIRNRFAHKGHALSFSDPYIVAECGNLRLWKPLSELLNLDSARGQFLLTTTALLQQLGIRALSAKRERRVKPGEFEIAQIVR